jgi:hypothetical protein
MDYILLNDCKSENAKAFAKGTNKTRSNINGFLEAIRKRGGTVTQVDYLGHSMGGLWGRLVEQNYGKNFLTYDKGLLHKLITLDTPHAGSYLANIGQFIIDAGRFIYLPGGLPISSSDYICFVSSVINYPVCDGAIKDLTSSGCKNNLNEVSVPAHAIISNKSTGDACDLLNLSKSVSGTLSKGIGALYKVSDMILRIIDHDYGCENWTSKFDLPIQSDYVVGLDSQDGGLIGSQLSEENGHWHMNSFSDSEVIDRFYELLNIKATDSAFAEGFPASSALLNSQQLLSLQTASKKLSSSESQTPMGDIQFNSPLDGAAVQPESQVTVSLTLTGNLTLNNMLIMAAGSDAVELVSPPYTTVITVPVGTYDTFVISALGEGTDGNLYSASVTLSVNSAAVLQKVDVTPQSLYLNLGQELDISVTGTYSDGTARSLSSSAQGTVYKSSDENILSVSANGTVTPHASGVGFVLVSPASSIPVTVRVEISTSNIEVSTLLWTASGGTASIWTMDASGNTTSKMKYGPYSGWTARNYHRNSDGTANMLWVNTDGAASVWATIDASGNPTGKTKYGPYSGWTAQSYHQNSDGTAQMLWVNTDGAASLWNINISGNTTSKTKYGPYSGWTAESYHQNSDGTGRMLWVNTDGVASLWNINTSGDTTSKMKYGPYEGWTAQDFD